MDSFDIPVKRLSALLNQKRVMLATAESCTGGMISMVITNLAGSSSVFDRGFITYSNDSKHELLGVTHEILDRHGAVSAETAQAMVQGIFTRSPATIGLSVTGIAGPGGGSIDKPVGLVYIGYGWRGQPVLVERHVFTGDRTAIRAQTTVAALHHLITLLEKS